MRGWITERLLGRLLRPPIDGRHVELSWLVSLDDDPAVPSERLLDIALAAVAESRDITLAEVAARVTSGPRFPVVWPGEHYRLLAGLVKVVSPKLIVEIGTYTGMSGLALKACLREDGRVVTFDIVPWQTFHDSLLTESDFLDGRLRQIIADLSVVEVCDRYSDLLASADLIFVDAAKDVVTERKLLQNFEVISFYREPIIVFDDVRLPNMLPIWRHIDRPKLDVTSFGHWSGTGLVDWTRTANASVRPMSPG